MNGTLIYGLSTMGVGILALLFRYVFKSKCSDVSICCGLIKIHRDIELENEAEEHQLEVGVTDEVK